MLRTPLRKSHGRVTLVLYNRPFNCGGTCLYCIAEKGLTKSTVRSEDTLMAKACGWDPVCQLRKRFSNYSITNGGGYKCGLAVKGDSFTNHKRDYMTAYFKQIYDFLNGYVAKDIDEALNRQRDAPDRVVQVQVETRPDLINEEVCNYLVRLGVTTVEIGVQSLDDSVLDLNRRGHGTDAVRKATYILRRYGFEVGYQMMVGLVGASFDLDLETLSETLWHEEYSPDVLKIYPCVLLKDFRLQKGLAPHAFKGWVPLTDGTYLELLTKGLPHVPPFVHINRIQRLIESDTIALGPRTLIDRKIFNGISRCLWQRGVAQSGMDLTGDFSNYTIKCYPQSEGFCFEANADNGAVLGYGRVSFLTDNEAMIRDIRVLGDMLPVGYKNIVRKGTQHIGIGRDLMRAMVNVARDRGRVSVKVHPAAGAVDYFQSLGFGEPDYNYMSLDLTH